MNTHERAATERRTLDALARLPATADREAWRRTVEATARRNGLGVRWVQANGGPGGYEQAVFEAGTGGTMGAVASTGGHQHW